MNCVMQKTVATLLPHNCILAIVCHTNANSHLSFVWLFVSYKSIFFFFMTSFHDIQKCYLNESFMSLNLLVCNTPCPVIGKRDISLFH